MLGNDHPDIPTSMNNLTLTRRALGNLDRTGRECGCHARPVPRAAAADEVCLGPEHPDMLAARVALGNWILIHSLAPVRRKLQEQ